MIAKLWASVIFTTIFPVSAFAEIQEIEAKCTTGGTSAGGERKGCDSELSSFTAPEGYFIAEKTLNGGLIESNGSEHDCRVGWADPTDVIPGVTQHRTITLQAHARSPKGHSSGSGWARCKYTFEVNKIP
ncbi:hypothetical protein [Mycetohabitans rhizoxinica]|uniref:Uncharacterized protein n=1 Tax=Mycetohabitans rhizoxinica TaxID=412963 RepID=A0ABZ2Q633_9BURK